VINWGEGERVVVQSDTTVQESTNTHTERLKGGKRKKGEEKSVKHLVI